MRFKDKAVLVTGGSRGIGRATAELFAEEGASVVICARSEKKLAEIKTAKCIVADVSRPEDVQKIFSEIRSEFGKLDIAINNAGVEGKISPITQQTLDDFDSVMNVNVRGLWLCMKNEIEMMLKVGSGNIVNVSSVAGLVGIAESALYVASKHAVIGLTRSLALEYARRGIRINAICPGGVETAMLARIHPDSFGQSASVHPIGRIASPEEIARAIAWLASEESSFVLGQAIAIDGGFTAQ